MHAASDPGRAILVPALALVMMDPKLAQRITARQLVILISVLQENMNCGRCRVGVSKEDPIHGLHSKFKSRGPSPELQYPADPEDVLKPEFTIPPDWEAPKRYWLKDHNVVALNYCAELCIQQICLFLVVVSTPCSSQTQEACRSLASPVLSQGPILQPR
jgi:hypothetical protein